MATSFKLRAGMRFYEIMRRHLSDDDADKTDDELVRAVFARYEKDRGAPLIDPNE
jgi:hypothetical protein